MASFKTNPIFCSLLLVCGLAVAADGWFIYAGYTAKSKALKKLEANQTELDNLNKNTIALNKENTALIKDDLAKITAVLTKMQAQLKGKGDAADQLHAAAVPASSADAYFSITTFVEKMREKFKEKMITIKADERFGFATYLHTGPDQELISQVFHQQQVANYLLDALIEAKPVELLSLQREHPQTKAERDEAAAAKVAGQSAATPSSSDNANDIFAIDPRITYRKAGFVDATAFRLSFVGKTDSLRSLLNELGSFKLPLVVRSVEVEAGDPEPAVPKLDDEGKPVVVDPAKQDSKEKPRVEILRSKFTVTIEYIDLVPAAQTSLPSPN